MPIRHAAASFDAVPDMRVSLNHPRITHCHIMCAFTIKPDYQKCNRVSAVLYCANRTKIQKKGGLAALIGKKCITTCSRDFGQFIRKKREEKGLRQQDVAEKIQVSQSYYSLIEQGLREIDLSQAIAICRILGLDISDFCIQYM